MKRPGILVVALAVIAGATTHVARAADEDTFQLGLRTAITTAGGEPANDMSTNGIVGRYRLTGGWRIGAAVEYVVYDFERPAKLLGLTQRRGTPTIDQKVKGTVVRLFVERDHRRSGSRWSFFWSAGLGASSPSADDVGGPLEEGGRFELTSDIGTEVLVGASAGVRRDLGNHFVLELALRADERFVDWTLSDRVSGRSVEVDDFLEYGAALGMSSRW